MMATKKNWTFKTAGILLALVLVTSCFVGGTFAKYVTSDSGQDSARVAKWGVNITATGDTAFAEKYDDEASETGTKVVSSVNGEDVLAPGTKGTLGGIKITGKPEVMVNIDVTADLKLTGWSITGDWDNDPETAETTIEYCPLVFKVGAEEIKMDGEITTVAALEAAVEKKLTDLSAQNVAANTDLATDRNVTISWEWAFEGENVKDTALGNLTTLPQIEFECEATVTQVD